MNHKMLGLSLAHGVLIRNAKPEHVLRNFSAWAFDQRFWSAHAGEIESVRIVLPDGTMYRANREDFEQFGFTKDLGRGPQMILRLSHFRVIGPGIRVAA
ncbi:MAG: hypothetical protein WCF84_10330 [Anaerolineae bacterium]